MKDIDFYEEYKKYKEQNANAKSFEEWQDEHYSILMNGDQQEFFGFVDLLNNNKWTKKYDNFEAAFYSWRNSDECPFLLNFQAAFFTEIWK